MSQRSPSSLASTSLTSSRVSTTGSRRGLRGAHEVVELADLAPQDVAIEEEQRATAPGSAWRR